MKKEIENQIKKAGKEMNIVKDVEDITKDVFGKIADGLHLSYGHKLTLGQKAADLLTKWAGSWTFILSLLFFLAIWIAINVLMVINRWDSYPFILLNLILSCLAAIQAPIILMSQNRAAQRDRIKAENDYKVNIKAEKGIQQIVKKLNTIDKKLR